MKTKTKITVTATVVAITSLMITTYHTQQPTPLVSPQIASVSEVIEVSRATTPPTSTEPIVAEEIAEIVPQKEKIIEPTPRETPLPQPTEKEESTNTPSAPTQTATKATTSTQATENTPKNGDTRIINGQQQGYLIGFRWVDYMGENTCTTDYGMYKNGTVKFFL